ncbi:MauE/DoxX family redox-associated membrane protein [Catellatospora sp. NPDC049111]|uniref:MauE/DoxX family redox-associated membrane protein n=1 Tax=Catellatospora sp. NPDC049111 TaxID=3155271 RepID=UPI003406BCAD
MRYVLLGCVVCLGVVFAVSAISKLRSRASYAAFVASTRELLPRPWPPAAPVALTVVVAEVAIVPLLFSVPTAGLAVAAVLLLAFSAAIVLAVRRGVRTSCRCFGSSTKPLAGPHAVRSGVLAALAVTGAVLAGPVGAANVVTGLHPAGVAITLLAAGVFAALMIMFDDLVGLFAPTATPAGRASMPAAVRQRHTSEKI